ncbi:uncharacterized protein LOC101852624 [Aplysia californica]|uniref:Uncharacterized protein LOC101852624 n=1 Tax=Aplysia californica TaxID=6500 RepID=A0ABM0ZZI2_APLCA|nr:uncharacterized protein LOC101852624 [Aplysia californica]
MSTGGTDSLPELCGQVQHESRLSVQSPASSYSTYSHEVKYIFEPVSELGGEGGHEVDGREEEVDEYSDYSHIVPRGQNFLSHTPRTLSASSQFSGKENQTPGVGGGFEHPEPPALPHGGPRSCSLSSSGSSRDRGPISPRLEEALYSATNHHHHGHHSARSHAGPPPPLSRSFYGQHADPTHYPYAKHSYHSAWKNGNHLGNSTGGLGSGGVGPGMGPSMQQQHGMGNPKASNVPQNIYRRTGGGLVHPAQNQQQQQQQQQNFQHQEQDNTVVAAVEKEKEGHNDSCCEKILKCLGLIPCPSLLSWILLLLGIGCLTGGLLVATWRTRDLLNDDDLLWFMEYSIIGVVVGMFVVATLILISSHLSSEPTSRRVFNSFSKNRCAQGLNIFALVMSYILTIAWTLLTAILATPLVFIVNLYIVDPDPLDLSVYGFSGKYTGNELTEFKEKTENLLISYAVAFFAAIVIVNSLVCFIICISSNIAHLRDNRFATLNAYGAEEVRNSKHSVLDTNM